MVIRCLLIEPYPESALNEEAGKALLEDYAGVGQQEWVCWYLLNMQCGCATNMQ